jgi:hypothetical protein
MTYFTVNSSKLHLRTGLLCPKKNFLFVRGYGGFRLVVAEWELAVEPFQRCGSTLHYERKVNCGREITYVDVDAWG